MSKGFYLDTPSQISDEDARSQLSRQFGDSDTDDDDDFSTLPFAKPLKRSDFLNPNFSAPGYLSTLRNRHQTLSDLRAELRTRSQNLAKELLDLVNDEYQAFLGLGSDLRGGEEKVEAVRVGVLGFVKGVEGVKETVVSRKEEVARLIDQKKSIARDIELGRKLIEVHTRITELEDALAITSKDDEAQNSDSDSGDDEEEEDEDGQDVSGVLRLERLVMQYRVVLQMIEQIGKEHPFLVKQAGRVDMIRNTLLLDLGNALKQAKIAGANGKSKLLRIVVLYGDMDEAQDAIRILKETNKR